MEHRALLQSDRMLVLSEFSRSQLRDIHAVSRDLVTVIPGGVDTSKFFPAGDRLALRAELALPPGPLLLTVRNLEPRMGLDTLIAAMRIVSSVRPECRLFIGGSGSLKARLAAQVHDLRLEQTVRFVGFIPEGRLADYYAAADLFVLPTRYLEGFGLVTVEALACGTPVLGTPVGGTEEILRHFDSRFLFAGTDAEAMATRILERLPEVVGNEPLRESCRRFALENHSWDALIHQIEVVMRGLIRQPASASA
jgi:glycosyltransferase involved in cell wall biosynthesis